MRIKFGPDPDVAMCYTSFAPLLTWYFPSGCRPNVHSIKLDGRMISLSALGGASVGLLLLFRSMHGEQGFLHQTPYGPKIAWIRAWTTNNNITIRPMATVQSGWFYLLCWVVCLKTWVNRSTCHAEDIHIFFQHI